MNHQVNSAGVNNPIFQYVPQAGTVSYGAADWDNGLTTESVSSGSDTMTYDGNHNLAYDGYNTLSYVMENRSEQLYRSRFSTTGAKIGDRVQPSRHCRWIGAGVPSHFGETVPPLPSPAASPQGLTPAIQQGGKPSKRKRPFPVTLVALYQIVRTVPLLMVVASLWGETTVDMASRDDLRMLIYLVTRQDIAAQRMYATPIVGIFLLLALYYAGTGVGLLLLMSWARRAAMLMSGMAMLQMVWFFVSTQARGQTVQMTDQQQVFLVVFILLDALVLSSLVYESSKFDDRR